MRKHYLVIEVNDDGTLGAISAHTEVDGQPLPAPELAWKPIPATEKGLDRLSEDIKGA